MIPEDPQAPTLRLRSVRHVEGAPVVHDRQDDSPDVQIDVGLGLRAPLTINLEALGLKGGSDDRGHLRQGRFQGSGVPAATAAAGGGGQPQRPLS